MPSSYVSAVVLLAVAAYVAFEAAAQTEDHCGKRKIPPAYPDYRESVAKVIDSLVEKTPGSQVHVARFPDESVGSAAGAAVCYARAKETCRGCLKEAAAVLALCNSMVDGYRGEFCLVQFWQTFDSL